MINLFKIFLKYAHVSYFHHFVNWNMQFWVLLPLSTMISKKNTWTRECVYTFLLVIVHFDSFERYEQFASINPDFHRELRCDLLQQWLILSCSWLEFQGLNASCGWFYPAANSSSGGWIQVAAVLSLSNWIYVTAESSSSGWIWLIADSILGLTWVPAAGCEYS